MQGSSEGVAGAEEVQAEAAGAGVGKDLQLQQAARDYQAGQLKQQQMLIAMLVQLQKQGFRWRLWRQSVTDSSAVAC
jgi:hypothetical protein